MKLSNMLGKESILQIETAPDKWSVIQQMIAQLDHNPFTTELDPNLRNSFFEKVKQREEIGSTGMGDGIAFPHARLDGLERPLIAFATLKEGVDFDAPDKLPARMIFLFLLPASRADLGVKIISVCSRFLMQEDVRKSLLEASSPDEIQQIMDQNTLEINAPIIALDLMRRERLRLTPDLSGNEATQLMHRCRVVAAPVVNENEQVIGELNCNTLFQRDLPDYITKLHSVPHISDFRPFEHYFSEDARLTVKDLMSDCSSIIDENASLLEIIFMLSVQKHPILYVCRNDRLIGIIDPITVLDRVLNL